MSISGDPKLLRILLVSNYLNVFAYSLFGPVFALFVLEVGGDSFHIGATFAFYMLVAGSLMIVLGKWLDRLSQYRLTLITVAYFALAFGALAFILVEDVWHLYLVQLLNALGIGLLEPTWKSVYMKAEAKGREVEEWAISDGGNRMLIAVAALGSGTFITYFSFDVLFIVMFLLQLLSAFLSLRLLSYR